MEKTRWKRAVREDGLQSHLCFSSCSAARRSVRTVITLIRYYLCTNTRVLFSICYAHTCAYLEINVCVYIYIYLEETLSHSASPIPFWSNFLCDVTDCCVLISVIWDCSPMLCISYSFCWCIIKKIELPELIPRHLEGACIPQRLQKSCRCCGGRQQYKQPGTFYSRKQALSCFKGRLSSCADHSPAL